MSDLERKIFNFIWNNKPELIKRKTIIKDCNSGGLNMICINSKVTAILLKQFQNILKNHERVEYQFSIIWLKFLIRKFLKNFNIIPTGNINDTPMYYKNMKLVVEKYKKNLIKSEYFSILSLKTIYIRIKLSYEITPRIEDLFRDKDWYEIYKTIMHKKLLSKYKVLNYKIIFNAITIKAKLNKEERSKIKCLFCGVRDPNSFHIFAECKITKYIIITCCPEFNFLNNDSIIFHEKLSIKDVILVSRIKFAINRLYNLCYYEVFDIKKMELSFLNFLK